MECDCTLFIRLYIASQHRNGDLDEFFRHENQPYPPSLSKFGKLWSTKKSDLLNCVEIPTAFSPPDLYNCKVFDGTALVHALPLPLPLPFLSMPIKYFVLSLSASFRHLRMDVVWDTYHCEDLRKATREKRGKETRKKVSGQAKLLEWQTRTV